MSENESLESVKLEMVPNKERIRLWVAALRSGRYEQCSGQLRHVSSGSEADGEFRYCCLGVACDISGLGHWLSTCYVTPQNNHSAYLPLEVRDWYGFENSDPRLQVEDSGRQNSASFLNDSQCMNFAQIADRIERTYLQDADQ